MYYIDDKLGIVLNLKYLKYVKKSFHPNITVWDEERDENVLKSQWHMTLYFENGSDQLEFDTTAEMVRVWSGLVNVLGEYNRTKLTTEAYDISSNTEE